MNTIRLRDRSRAPLIAAALIAMAAFPAAADGWSLFATLSQRFEADSNLRLDPGSHDPAFGSVTTAGLNIISQTPRTRLEINPQLTGTLFTGSDNSDSNQISPRLATRVSHRVGTVDLSGGLVADVRPTTFSEFGFPDSGVPDLDLIDRDATQISVLGNLGVGYDLDPRTRFTFDPIVNVIRYTDDSDSLSPSTTIGANAGISHGINERIALQGGVGVRRIDIGGAQDSDTTVVDVNGGVSGQITPRFYLDGLLGASFLDTEDAAGDTSTGIGFNANVSAIYQASEDLSLSLTARQGVEPSSTGELETRTTIGASGRYQINRREGVDMGFGYSRQVSASTFSQNSDEQNQLYASLGYSLAVTPEVTARVGYLGRWVPDSSREAMSHKVFVSFSRSFTLSP
ncbi:hypothetical protein [Pikeienuella sp. HZG-20]|uniref:hypothetical protein n=1 Tax=Paludibacillus litoralis TaxID=3133267 RepID=UPI0030EF98F2